MKISSVSLFFVAILVFITIFFQSEKLTGIEYHNDLSVVEMKDKANFEFKYTDSIPIDQWEVKCAIEVLKYEQREKHNLRFTFENEQTKQRLNILISQNESPESAESQEPPLGAELVSLSSNTTAFYVEDEIAQKLWWEEDGISYGLIYFIYKGQQALDMSDLTQIAASMQ
jgi:hypothetical protein